jgi:hypothetical protein
MIKRLISFIKGLFKREPYFVTVLEYEKPVGGIFESIPRAPDEVYPGTVFPYKEWLGNHIVNINEVEELDFPINNLITEDWDGIVNPYISTDQIRAAQKLKKEQILKGGFAKWAGLEYND